MQTNFTSEQLADPALAEANQIIQTCVHYGFCTNTCPTYVITRDENESPRGRIDLIKSMLESGAMPRHDTVRHIDSCLSCLSCMTTCAAKVDYVHLIDRARTYIEQRYRRPLPDRAVRAALCYVLPRPDRFKIALALGGLARRLKLPVPSGFKPLIGLIPEKVDTAVLAPQVFRASAPRKHRVALLAGCAQQVLNANINSATIRLLTRNGCDVVIAPGAGCCGSLTLHMGREATARKYATRNVLAWRREVDGDGLDAVIVNASGCGTTVKDYGHILAREQDVSEPAQSLAKMTFDITEFLLKIGMQVKPALPRFRVAYHDPCSMQHGQKVTRPPRELLTAAGFDVLNVPEAHFCCGSAGTYNLLQPAMAQTLGARKAAHIRSVNADILATGNIGCMTQLGQFLQLPAVHTVELLDWATGGPIPPALAGVSLPDRTRDLARAPEALAPDGAPPISNENAIW